MKQTRVTEAAFNEKYAIFEAQRNKVVAENDAMAEELQRYVSEKMELDLKAAKMKESGEKD